MALKKSLADLAVEVRERGRVHEVDVDELVEAQREEPDLLVIDVREPDERARGAVPGSVHIPRGVLERDIEKKAFGGNASDADMKRPIICYCGGGQRSLLAGDALVQMGFTDVGSLAGGFKAWGDSGRPVHLDRGT